MCEVIICANSREMLIVRDVFLFSDQPPFQVLAAIPEDCTPSTCDYYAAWRQNSDFDFVDFRIEGNVQGWLALGLSEDRLMVSVTVITH